MDNPIAKNLVDTFTFKGPREKLSNAIDSAKQALSNEATSVKNRVKSVIEGPTPPTTYKYDQKAVAPKASPSKPAGKMPSYKTGTDYVPKTGPAKLHKGEAVLKKEDAEKMRSHMTGAAAALGHSEEKPKKEIKHIVTKKAKTGGFIHEHHHTHPEHYPMEEHVTPDQDSMVEHMMEHMGTPNDGEQEADAGQMPGGMAQPQAGAMGA